MKNISLYRYFLFIMIAGSFILASCVPATPGSGPAPTPTQPAATATQPYPTQQPESTPTAPQMAAVQAAVQALAKVLNIDPAQVSVVSFQTKEWPDTCLGLGGPNESCGQMVVPGVEGMLIANRLEYGFRADEAGQTVRIIPGAVLAAQKVLAQKAGVQPVDVGIQFFEKVEWPDACLGVSVEGQMCAQVVTPGYRVVFNLNGASYEYHTDESGSIVAPATIQEGPIDQGVANWTQTIDGKCVSASIDLEKVFYGPCEGQKTSAPLSEIRQAELARLLEKFAPFDAETVVGKISFNGKGQITATTVQQRALAEWALLVNQESEPGRDAVDQGLAFAWYREGGIAGFCDDVTVYLTGFAYVTSCKGNQAKNLGGYLLTGQELHQIYSLLGQYQRFEADDKDNATADAMTIRIVFAGTGNRETDPVVKDNLSALASQIVAQANTQQNSEEIGSALQTLRDYYQALHDRDYAKAIELYGGDFDTLTGNNTDIAPTDKTGLFQRACTQNGFQCDLVIHAVADQAQLSDVDFRFSLEFQNPDGSAFGRGPCCGASEQDDPRQTQFDFHVKKVDGKYLVMDLPVYVP